MRLRHAPMLKWKAQRYFLNVLALTPAASLALSSPFYNIYTVHHLDLSPNNKVQTPSLGCEPVEWMLANYS